MTPGEQRDRAKRVIVELVRQAGGEFQNKTNLFKAFWRAHLSYADANLGYLSNWPIVRMPRGPGIDNFDHLLAEMLTDDWLTIDERQVGDCTAMVFATGEKSPSCTFTAAQVTAIRNGVAAVRAKSARFVSDQSHKDSRVWNEAKDGETLDIYLDLIPDSEREDYGRSIQALSGAIRNGQ
jgi:hypothetical protein